MLDRAITSRLRTATKSILLLGARQVGKSTLMRSLSPSLVINLADEAAHLSFAKDWSRLRREVAALVRPSVILIDEVQRLPALLNTVQAILDDGVPHRFLLTGSSARKLKRGGANLLPGRVVLEYLDPLSYWEMGRAFDLERCLQIGGLPGVYLDRDHAYDVLGTYATVYLREEIKAEALARDVGTYARFLDITAALSGQFINYSKLASDSEIPKETVRRFVEILEDTLLAFRLPPYASAIKPRRISQRERILFFDLGVRNALLGTHSVTPSPTERGSLFEQWLILQCLYFARAHRLPWRFFSYRTDGGAEVDLIIETPRELVALECKTGRQVTAAQLTGLASFAEIAPKPVKRFVVYGGERAQRFPDGTLAVPFETFLRENIPALAAASESR